MGVRRALEKLVADAVRAQMDQTLDRAFAPIRAKAEEGSTETAQKAAAPLQAGIERVVGQAVEQVGGVLLKCVLPGKRGATAYALDKSGRKLTIVIDKDGGSITVNVSSADVAVAHERAGRTKRY